MDIALLKERLSEMMSLRRICVEVNRVVRHEPVDDHASESRGRGRRSSRRSTKRVNTDQFTLSLFPGGNAKMLDRDQARVLVSTINAAIAEVLTAQRDQKSATIRLLIAGNLSLEEAKEALASLDVLQVLDRVGLSVVEGGVGVYVQSEIASVTMTGNDAEMSELVAKLNAAIGAVMNPLIEACRKAVREAAAQ